MKVLNRSLRIIPILELSGEKIAESKEVDLGFYGLRMKQEHTKDAGLIFRMGSEKMRFVQDGFYTLRDLMRRPVKIMRGRRP